MAKTLTQIAADVATTFPTTGLKAIPAASARTFFTDQLTALQVGGGMKSATDGSTDLAVASALTWVDVKPYATDQGGTGVARSLANGTLSIEVGGGGKGFIDWSLTITVAVNTSHFVRVVKGVSTELFLQSITTGAVNQIITFSGRVFETLADGEAIKLQYTNLAGGGGAADNIVQSVALNWERKAAA